MNRNTFDFHFTNIALPFPSIDTWASDIKGQLKRITGFDTHPKGIMMPVIQNLTLC